MNDNKNGKASFPSTDDGGATTAGAKSSDAEAISHKEEDGGGRVHQEEGIGMDNGNNGKAAAAAVVSAPAVTAAAADIDSQASDTAATGAASSNEPLSVITDALIVMTRPGAYPIAGPGFQQADSPEIASNGDEESGENDNEDDNMVFEGFVPEQLPTQEDLLERQARDQARELLASATTLDDTHVRTIPMDNEDIMEINEDREEDTPKPLQFIRSPITLVFLTVAFLAAIGLGVAFGGSNSDGEVSVSSCPQDFQARYNHAKSLILNGQITSKKTLQDESSPQSKALHWIACEDQISSQMIDNRDPDTGTLPKQAYGTQFGEDSGESQVLRRYALATFYYSTSQSSTKGGAWNSTWNFLSPTEHECQWHQNYTRGNFPFGEIDPAGFVCGDPTPVGWGEVSKFWNEEYSDIVIGSMILNFRIRNNLNGILPPEIGYISGLTAIMMSYQDGLYGSIPSAIGNLVNLDSISIEFAGPNFGGEIPSSLFTLPSMEYISFFYWEGVAKFPPTLGSGTSRNLMGLKLIDTRCTAGAIPPYLSEFPNMKELEIVGSLLGGTIPESFGNLTSLEYFNFYNNSLTGTLPESLGKLDSLTTMVFGRNKIQGTIPSWLGNLDKLLLLDLSYNEFEGSLPTGLSQMSSLEHISLQHNANLNGSISAFEPLQQLSSLLLYGNSFSSTIPKNLFANFTKHIFADFGHNKFTGKLPQTFSDNAKNTSYLAIMRNELDTDAVDDVICNEVGILNADCGSCPCCASCCSDDSIDSKDPSCNYDLDFFRLTKLECGLWWYACYSADPQVYYDVEPT